MTSPFRKRFNANKPLPERGWRTFSLARLVAFSVHRCPFLLNAVQVRRVKLHTTLWCLTPNGSESSLLLFIIFYSVVLLQVRILEELKNFDKRGVKSLYMRRVLDGVEMRCV